MLATIRDVVTLVMAVTPVFRAVELGSVLHLAALFWNDCLYLAHHLARLHTFLKLYDAKHMGWIDLVAPLKALGGKYFVLQIATIKREVSDNILSIGIATKSKSRDLVFDVSQIENASGGRRCLDALRRALFLINRVNKQLGEVMSRDLLLKRFIGGTGGLLDRFVLSPLLRGIILQPKASVEAKRRCNDLVHLIAHYNFVLPLAELTTAVSSWTLLFNSTS
jgi:hypothetical protein